MRLVKTFGDGAAAAEVLLAGLERRGAVNTAKVDGTVRGILEDVRAGGLKVLTEYATRLDGLRPAGNGSGGAKQSLRVSREEMKEAWDATDATLRNAMQMARENIRAFAERQMPKSWTFAAREGVETGQIVRALSSVGCYVPGGRYPLPSTLLMTVTPAQVAGVERNCGVFAEAGAGDDGGGMAGGGDGVLPRGWSAGGGGDGVWGGGGIGRGSGFGD